MTEDGPLLDCLLCQRSEIIAQLRERLDAVERERNNLLARIHRDGGQYVQHHGVKKALADAHSVVATALLGVSDLLADRDQLRLSNERMREAIENLRSHWTNKHTIKTALDQAIVEAFLALTAESGTEGLRSSAAHIHHEHL
jgi:hypothetical protein